MIEPGVKIPVVTMSCCCSRSQGKRSERDDELVAVDQPTKPQREPEEVDRSRARGFHLLLQ